MKNLLKNTWISITSIFKEGTPPKLSMGRVFTGIIFVSDLIIWFGGTDIPPGMLYVTSFLLTYVTGSKVVTKLTDFSTLALNLKTLKAEMDNGEKTKKSEVKK